ncbi:MAG: hypothetical protein SOY94_01415 [Candidatus Limiplasma sp.]|nr:hypothetical protein [Candidatus Limiplasma sp.]
MRELSHEEIIGVTTLNVCVNAVRDSVEKLGRRLTGDQKSAIDQSAGRLTEVVKQLIECDGDEDQREMILRRMSRLKLQFGVVRKHPEDLVIMTMDDAQTLLAPVLDRCDLDCPCVDCTDDGERSVRRDLVKKCETRKALKRIGLSEVGLSMECPYQYIL